MNSKLKELRQEEKRLLDIINMNLMSVPHNVRPSWKGKINESKDRLPLVQRGILDEILHNSYVVKMSKGFNNIQSFKDITSGDASCIVLDFYDLENELFNRTFSHQKPPYAVNSSTRDMLNKNIAEIRDLMMAEGFMYINIPASSMEVLNNKSDVINKFNKILELHNIDEFRNIYTNFQLRKSLMSKINDLDKSFIFITNMPLDKISSITVTSTEEVELLANEENADSTDADLIKMVKVLLKKENKQKENDNE